MVYVKKRRRWRASKRSRGFLSLEIRQVREFVLDRKATTPEPYLRYNVTVAEVFRPAHDDYVVVPESSLNWVPLAGAGTPIIWWLSVDNIAGGFGELLQLRNRPALHFAQSRFAAEVARALGFEVSGLLTDYISSAHVDQSEVEGRRDGVAYNPRKGLPYLEMLKPYLAGVHLRPIENMTPEQVANLLRSAKVYLEVGDHPGRDRLPREAALAGAVVVSSRIGGSWYTEDMPLTDEFKFSKKRDDPKGVAEKVCAAVAGYEAAKLKQAEYRQWVRGQQDEFGRQVEAMLAKLIG